MYSVVRENFYDSGKLSRADKEVKEFQSIHAAQPGYRGNIVVDLGGVHMLIVTLWESESTAHAAREALEPDIQRLLVPLMTKPSHLVGAGHVRGERCLPRLDTMSHATRQGLAFEKETIPPRGCQS